MFVFLLNFTPLKRFFRFTEHLFSKLQFVSSILQFQLHFFPVKAEDLSVEFAFKQLLYWLQ